jgi:hypothetical protein
LAAPRPDCFADPNLTGALGRAGGGQAGEVYASDEEQEEGDGDDQVNLRDIAVLGPGNAVISFGIEVNSGEGLEIVGVAGGDFCAHVACHKVGQQLLQLFGVVACG